MVTWPKLSHQWSFKRSNSMAKLCILNHGSIIRTGITSNKIFCYMRDSVCRWFIVKKHKIYWSYVKHFWILAVWENVVSWLVYANYKLFRTAQPYFSTDIIKLSYFLLPFLAFKTFNKKNKVSYKVLLF